MGRSRMSKQPRRLEEEWVASSPDKLMAGAEPQESVGQFDRLTGLIVWSEKPGRLAWPLSVLIIVALSVGLWAAIIFGVRSLLI